LDSYLEDQQGFDLQTDYSKEELNQPLIPFGDDKDRRFEKDQEREKSQEKEDKTADSDHPEGARSSSMSNYFDEAEYGKLILSKMDKQREKVEGFVATVAEYHLLSLFIFLFFSFLLALISMPKGKLFLR